LKEAMARADGDQPNSKVFGEIEWSDGKTFIEVKDPFTISAEKLWDDI